VLPDFSVDMILKTVVRWEHAVDLTGDRYLFTTILNDDAGWKDYAGPKSQLTPDRRVNLYRTEKSIYTGSKDQFIPDQKVNL